MTSVFGQPGYVEPFLVGSTGVCSKFLGMFRRFYSLLK